MCTYVGLWYLGARRQDQQWRARAERQLHWHGQGEAPPGGGGGGGLVWGLLELVTDARFIESCNVLCTFTM